MRQVAAATGLSHQKVSRALHAMQENRFNEQSKAWTDPETRAMIETAFSLHKEVTRQTAKAQQLPYDPEMPVYLRRSHLPDGKNSRYLSGAFHTHWLTDDMRKDYLTRMQRTGKFYFASVRSTVNLRDYNRQAQVRADEDRRTRRKRPSEQAELYADQLQTRLDSGYTTTGIFTAKTPFAADRPTRHVVAQVLGKLRTKHSPAANGPGTAYADQIRFQLDTRTEIRKGPSRGKTARKQTTKKRSK